MTVGRNPRKRGARFTLPASGHDHQFVSREAHRRIEFHRRRKIAQQSVRLRGAYDPVQRTPRDAKLAAGALRHIVQRLEPGSV
jgi:hypothetical protein